MPAPRQDATAPAQKPTEGAFRALIRTFGLLQRIMEPYFAQFGISGAQWGVLRQLHRAEQEGLLGLRLADLGERLLIRPPTVTGTVDRLERAGWVRRRGLPEDLRAKRVALTATGRQLVERVLERHATQIDKVMGGLSLKEQAQLERGLRKLGQHMDRLLAPEPSQEPSPLDGV